MPTSPQIQYSVVLDDLGSPRLTGFDASWCVAQAVKVYPQGKMSQHIDGLKVGETLDIKVGVLALPPSKCSWLGRLGSSLGISWCHPRKEEDSLSGCCFALLEALERAPRRQLQEWLGNWHQAMHCLP